MSEGEERFQAAVAAVQGVIWTNNAIGEMEGEQPGWAALTGQHFEEYQGYGWTKAVHPDDAGPTVNAWQAAVNKQAIFIFEHRIKVKDGSWRLFSIRAVPIKTKEGIIKEWVGVHTDITEQRKAENALKDSEEKFRTMAESSNILIGVNNESINAVYFNKEWEKLTGRPVSELLDLGWADLLHPDDKEPLLNKFLIAFKNKVSYDGEFRILNKEGTYSWIYARVQVRLNTDGSYAGHISSCIDITERKQNENALKESEQRCRALVKATSDVVYRMNADWTEMRQLEGRGFLSDTGEPIKDWLQKYIHPSDQQRVQKAINESIQSKRIFELEHQVLQVDGSTGWTFSRAIPIFDDNGNIIEWFGAASDITERKRSEVILKQTTEESEQRKRLYEAITGNTPDLIYVFDLNYRFTYANDALLNMWGKTWDASIGKTLLENGYEPWHAEMHEKEIDQVVATKKSIRGEVSFPHATLGKRIYDYIFVPVINDKGEVEAIAGTTRDISEFKIAEESIKESESYFRSLTDTVPAIIWITEPDGYCSYLNKTWYQYTGQTETEGEGFGWLTATHPDDADEAGKAFVKANNEQKPFSHLYRLKVKDGTYRWARDSGSPRFDKDGKYAGMIGTVVDVHEEKLSETKIKESEANLRNTVLAAPVGMCIMDANTLVSEIVNETFVEIAGKPYESIIGHNYWDTFAEAKPYYESALQSVVDTGEPFYANEVELMLIRHGNEEIVYVTFVYMPMKDSEGTVKKVVVWVLENTKQVHARRSLEASEKLLRKTTEHLEIATTAAEVGTWSLDLKSQTLEWSGLHKSMWGYDPHRSDLKYEDWYNIILPDDKEAAFAEVEKALKTKTPYEASYRIQRSGDGTIRWILSTGQYFYNESGEAITLTGVSIDITEEKQAEIALKESENLYHNLIYSSPSAIGFLMGPDLKITKANDEIIRIWGKGTDVFGKPYFQLMPELIEQGYPEIFNNVYNSGAATSFLETPVHILQNGEMTLKYYNFILYPQRNIDNHVEGIGIIATEVTSQAEYNNQVKESEKRFRLLADTMPQLVWTANVDGNLNYYNQSVLDYSGLTLDQINKDGWLQIVHPDDREENINHWMTSIQTGTEFIFEHRFKRYDGEYRWQLSRAVPQRDATGTITMWVGSSTDIQKIKEEEKRKGDFIKMVSHELKTPVTSIKGYAQFLLGLLKNQPEENKILSLVNSSLVRIDIQIIRLTRLITEMLDLSRIESGKLELQKSNFNLNELVKETIQDISQTITTHKIELHEDFKCEIVGDRDRLGQVLINFTNNAIKYSPKSDRVNITISKNEQNQATVRVEDFGIGINKEEQLKIFEPFYRVEGKREETFSGFGIGLYIANEIILRHGGSIKVESAIGKGSAFTFAIPLSS